MSIRRSHVGKLRFTGYRAVSAPGCGCHSLSAWVLYHGNGRSEVISPLKEDGIDPETEESSDQIRLMFGGANARWRGPLRCMLVIEANIEREER